MNERDGFGAIKHVEDVLIDVRQEVERQPTGSDKPPLQITYVPRSVTGKSSDGAARIRLWDRAFELLLVMDASARIVDVSPAWASTLGWPIEHLIGRNFNELVHPVDIATLPTPWNERPEAIRAPSTLDRRLRCSVGGYRTISWVMFDNGDLIYAAGRDMGSGRQSVPIYETAPEQLSQSQKMETVGQLTSGVAHDFNNLLQPIIQALELIQRQAARGDYARLDQHAALALKAANRAAALALRLLTFSRCQTEEASVTDVNRVVTGLEELVRWIVTSNVHVHLSCRRALWPALINTNQFENALLNLCLNARDAMPGGGDLTIATSNLLLDAGSARAFDVSPGPYLSVSVADTGAGVPPEIVDHIFEPFFTTKPVGSGTGLGLATVYGFAKQAGGHIEVASRLKHGTTFTIYLPKCNELHAAASSATSHQRSTSTDHATSAPIPHDHHDPRR